MASVGTISKTLDIRDIKEEVVYPELSALDVMFRLQKVLVDHYVGIEGLPEYPIDINTRNAQVLVKDFIGRIIEELGESWESMEIMMDMKDNPLNNDDRTLLIPHLQNFNEELADALHFWLELMVFINFTPTEIKVKIMNQYGVSLLPKIGVLETLFYYAKQFNDANYPDKAYPAYMVLRDADVKDLFLMGGRKIGTKRVNIMKQMLWDITFSLQIARNTLKNKPWKQSEMMTDEGLFYDKVWEATFNMFIFFDFAGLTPESLYHIYYKKNMVNQFRIKSKY